jgi:hypothetical protein
MLSYHTMLAVSIVQYLAVMRDMRSLTWWLPSANARGVKPLSYHHSMPHCYSPLHEQCDKLHRITLFLIYHILQVDFSKVNLAVLKPWIATEITKILGFEDDVVIDFTFGLLETQVNMRATFSFF